MSDRSRHAQPPITDHPYVEHRDDGTCPDPCSNPGCHYHLGDGWFCGYERSRHAQPNLPPIDQKCSMCGGGHVPGERCVPPQAAAGEPTAVKTRLCPKRCVEGCIEVTVDGYQIYHGLSRSPGERNVERVLREAFSKTYAQGRADGRAEMAQEAILLICDFCAGRSATKTEPAEYSETWGWQHRYVYTEGAISCRAGMIRRALPGARR